jgi:hypothetical protein
MVKVLPGIPAQRQYKEGDVGEITQKFKRDGKERLKIYWHDTKETTTMAVDKWFTTFKLDDQVKPPAAPTYWHQAERLFNLASQPPEHQHIGLKELTKMDDNPFDAFEKMDSRYDGKVDLAEWLKYWEQTPNAEEILGKYEERFTSPKQDSAMSRAIEAAEKYAKTNSTSGDVKMLKESHAEAFVKEAEKATEWITNGGGHNLWTRAEGKDIVNRFWESVRNRADKNVEKEDLLRTMVFRFKEHVQKKTNGQATKAPPIAAGTWGIHQTRRLEQDGMDTQPPLDALRYKCEVFGGRWKSLDFAVQSLSDGSLVVENGLCVMFSYEMPSPVGGYYLLWRSDKRKDADAIHPNMLVENVDKANKRADDLEEQLLQMQVDLEKREPSMPSDLATTFSEEGWSDVQSRGLGATPPLTILRTKCDVISERGQTGAIVSVNGAVNLLTKGTITSERGLCVVFSASKDAYWLLWHRDKADEAAGLSDGHELEDVITNLHTEPQMRELSQGNWLSIKAPFHRTREVQRTWERTFIKWFLPFFFNGCCLYVCMWLLHIATYRYVHRMTSLEETLSKQIPESSVDKIIRTYGALDDPVAEHFPRKNVTLTNLDRVSLVFPFMFMSGVVVFDELELFTKIMLCNGLLALAKGLLDSMTILPDSSGWSSCKDRLGPFGLSWMQQSHTGLELFFREGLGVQGHHLRWCSDMLLSGHTYLTTLYALGAYELIRKVTRRAPEDIKRLAIISICVFAIAEQLIEIYVVTIDRFHYTMDIAVAVVVTLVLYTSIIPAAVSKWWVYYRAVDEDASRLDDILEQIDSEADVFVPICCIPFCCFVGRHHTFEDARFAKLLHKVVEHMPNTTNAKRQAVLRKNLSRDAVGEGVRLTEPLLSA